MDKEQMELSRAIEDVWEIGIGMGLDPFPVHFEIVPSGIMYEFGAYGIPGRFSHWTHGKAYEQMKTMYDHGLSKIYELVINTNPSYAFLMEGNSLVQNKMVAAHVMAHSDFFKNNIYFQHTSRNMLETVSIDARQIRNYEERFGAVPVEEFMDAVLAIQEHVDTSWVRQKRINDKRSVMSAKEIASGPYDDLLGVQQLVGAKGGQNSEVEMEPEKDILWYIAEHAPDLKDWQRDIIGIVRHEMLYFVPQMQTKIMNEGWATFWHLRIMREAEISEDDYLEFARLHAGVLSPLPGKRGINPYTVGLKIFEDIERRWDGRTLGVQPSPGHLDSRGRQKILEVRELDSDPSFLRNYLTEELIEELDLYTYELRDEQWVVSDRNWEHVRDQLVDSMTNLGHPTICVVDGNYRGNNELYLKHFYEGKELDIPYAEHALRHVYTLWGRPVYLETVRKEHSILMSYDGDQNSTIELGSGQPFDTEFDTEPAS